MAVAAATQPAVSTRAVRRRSESPPRPLRTRLLRYLPQGNLLDDASWRKRHAILQWLLMLHMPGLTVFGLWMGHGARAVALAMVPITACLVLGALIRRRRPASFFTTAGIVYCSSALVGLSHGMIEAHFHFFIIIGFIALYQDWVPFLWNILFTVLSHGLGSAFLRTDLIFGHHAGIANPWTWSLIHGVAVLAGCVGVVLFWRTSEDEQQRTLALTRELGETKIVRFTSDLLVNLARRNQSMLYRQLDIINQLEEQERDPDALAELFRLDHLATRIRRNAESLLVLSGEEPPRVWSQPVGLVDVVRAAIAETEDLSRVAFVVDERLAVLGHSVTDLTHLLAELIENAVRFSPPGTRVTIRSTPDVRSPGATLLTVEDWGVGMRPEDLAAANDILARPRDVDAVASQRLGLHVVARLAHRHAVKVSLTSTSGAGITAVLLLPPELFAPVARHAVGVVSIPQGWSAQSWPATQGWSAPHEGQPQLPAMPGRPRRSPHRAVTQNGTGPINGGPINGGPINGGPVNGGGPYAGVPYAGAPHGALPHGGLPHGGLPNGGAPAAGGAPVNALPVTGEATAWSGWWEAEARDPRDRQPEIPAGWRPVAPLVPDMPSPVAPPVAPAAALPGAVTPEGNGGRNDTPVDGAAVQEVISRLVLPDDPVPPGEGDGETPVRLSRRTPQASLAPELRRGQQPVTTEPAAPQVPPPDAARAMDALSRYQANRQAALATTKDDGEEERS